MQRLTVIGVSASAPGAIGKSGKPYSIGQLHTMAPLAPAFAAGGVEAGMMGVSYRCDPEVCRRIAHLPFPLVCDVELQTVMQFGKPETSALDAKPVEAPVKRAA
jgi:hypothetical protein